MPSSVNGDAAEPFKSLDEMRAAYHRLVRRYGKTEVAEPRAELLGEIGTFVARGRLTGTLLDAPDDRWDAQSMLNYWATILYRHRPQREDEPLVTNLAPFGSPRSARAGSRGAPFLAPPEPPDVFVGREDFLSDLKQQLTTPDNLALYGSLGTGMTAIATRLAHDPELRQKFPDGVLWASLGERPDVSGIINRWGEALGLTEAGKNRFVDLEHRKKVVRRDLANRRMLIVIDDAWNAGPALALKLGGPHCAHLVTTYLMPVALSFDTDGTVAVPGLSPSDGLTLFARHVPDAARERTEEILGVIEALEGSPLAISLLARHLGLNSDKVPPPDFGELRRQLLKPLTRKEAVEPAGRPSPTARRADSVDIPPPLWAAIAWCYEHLEEDERRALRALSRFPPKPNSISEEAAHYMTWDGEGTTLKGIVRYGLVERCGQTRFTMHRAVAGYLRPSTRERVEFEDDERMVSFYVRLVSNHESDLPLLQQEEKNILAALELAARHKLWGQLIEGANALLEYFDRRGLYALAKEWLSKALKAATQLDDRRSLMDINLNLGEIEERLSQYTDATKHLTAALKQARLLGDHAAITRAMQGLGVVAMAQANYPLAERHLKEALVLSREIKDKRRECAINTRLGWLERGRGRFDLSRDYSQKGLRLAQENQDAEQIAELKLSLGVLAYFEGEYELAESLDREGLEWAEKARDSRLRCGLLQALGGVEIELGNFEDAEGHLLESLHLSREIGHRWYNSVIWKEIGELRLKQGLLNAATEAFTKSMQVARDVSSQELIGLALYGLARTAAARQNFPEARLQAQTSLSIFETMGHSKENEVRDWLNTLF